MKKLRAEFKDLSVHPKITVLLQQKEKKNSITFAKYF